MSITENKYTDAQLAAAERTAVVRKSDRESLWFLGDNVQIILDASHTEGRLFLAYQHLAAGATPPLHEHDLEDEILLLLEGEVTFWTVGKEFTLGPGDCILLPKDTPHTLQVSPDGDAKWILITAPTGFEQFLRDVSEPATYDGPKRDWQMDQQTAQKLGEAAERAKINIIAPPGVRP
jgi:quercetin dioxygenase-like cupin family protein